MDLKLLRTFLSVARLRSFSQAADVLHCSQSTVSAQIRMLEDMLGVPFFDRLGRTVTLTTAGEKLLHYAERLSELAEEARADVAGEKPGGTLSVRIPDSLSQRMMPSILSRFRQNYSDANVRLTSCAGETTASDLRKGMVDLAFLLSNAPLESDLCSERIANTSLEILAVPGHPLAQHQCVTPAQLAQETVIYTPSDCSYNRLVESAFVASGVVPERLIEVNSVATLIACLEAGLGVGALPSFAAEPQLRKGTLITLNWNDAPKKVGVLMLWHRSKWHSPLLTAFIECAGHEIKSQLS